MLDNFVTIMLRESPAFFFTSNNIYLPCVVTGETGAQTGTWG